jgi:RND family efflux transporter MFP subunit
MIFSKKILVLVLTVLVVALVVYYFGFKKGGLFRGKDTVENATEDSSAPAQSPLPVRVAEVKRSDLVIKLNTPGEAVTDRRAVIRSETSGRLKKLHVEEGQAVEKGDLMVELDDRERVLDLEKAEASRLRVLSEILLEKQFSEFALDKGSVSAAELEEAKKEYEIRLSQFRKGLVSEKEWEQALKNYEMLLIESGQKKDEIMAATKGLTQQEISVKAARLNLEKTRILAPFSGIVSDIHVSEQQQVSESTELFTLVDNSRVFVQANVLESEIGKMHAGRQVVLRFSAYPDQIFPGHVKAVSPIIDPEDKTCRVIISLVSPHTEIKPGMYADVEIEAEVYANRLLVPQAAIVLQSGQKFVYVVKDGLAKRTDIQTGVESEDYAEVLLTGGDVSGLTEGDLVIIEGHFNLAHEAPVRIIEE